MIEAPYLILPPERPALVRANDMARIPSIEEMRARLRAREATFPFPVFLPGSVPPAVLTYIGYSENDGSAQEHTGVSVGTAASDRYVIFALHESKTSGSWSANPISSPTVNGAAATLVGTQVNNNASVVAIYIKALSTGTTATFAWTLADSSLRSVIFVWNVTGLISATPTATASSTASPPSASLAIPSSGFGIGIAAVDSSGSFSWSNMTKHADVSSMASGASSTTAGTATRTATPTTNDKPVLSLAAFN